MGRDQHVNDLPVPVCRMVNVPPDTVDRYVRLIDAPICRRVSDGRPGCVGQERREPLHPPVEVTAGTRRYRVWLWALEVRDMPELSSTRSAY